MLDSDFGRLLRTPPLATHWRWAAIARVAKSESRRWRSLSSELPPFPPAWFDRLARACVRGRQFEKKKDGMRRGIIKEEGKTNWKDAIKAIFNGRDRERERDGN